MKLKGFIIFCATLFTFQAMSQQLQPREKKGKWGFRLYGKVLIKHEYDAIEKVNFNSYLLQKDNLWGAINSLGEFIIPCEYDAITYGNKGKGYTVQKSGLIGFRDDQGVELIPCEYDDFKYYNSIYAAKKNGKWGAVNLEDEKSNLPFEYSKIKYDPIYEYYLVEKKKKEGVISSKGEVLIPIEYEDVDRYGKEESLIKQKGEWMLLKEGLLTKPTGRIIFRNTDKRALFKDCPEVTGWDEKRKCSESAMLQFLYRTMRYPAEAREKNIQGTCVAKMDISPAGKITDIQIVRELGGGCSEETIRVIEEMEDWIPAEKDGEKVWARYVLPLRFKLQ